MCIRDSDGTGIFDFIREFGVKADTDMSGDTSTERDYSLKTTISCVVTEVQDNGNLVICLLYTSRCV